MIRPPLNNVVVKVKYKFSSAITSLAKISAIQNNASINLEDYVTITGEVVSLPLGISKRRDYNGFSTKDIKVGDTAIFSYSVIYDFVANNPEEEPKFRNSFMYNGVEYFNCDILNLFAVIRDGEIRMQNGYVMLSGLDKIPSIILPAGFKKRLTAVSGDIISIGEPFVNMRFLNCKNGDRIWFSPHVAQEYKINNKPFWIISQRHILGVEEPCVTG